MVCGSLGELTKLRAYGFQFWFQVISFQKRSSERLQCTHHLFSLGCLYSDILDSCYDILRYNAYDFYMKFIDYGFY